MIQLITGSRRRIGGGLADWTVKFSEKYPFGEEKNQVAK